MGHRSTPGSPNWQPHDEWPTDKEEQSVRAKCKCISRSTGGASSQRVMLFVWTAYFGDEKLAIGNRAVRPQAQRMNLRLRGTGAHAVNCAL
jgi:hypothetical protein